MVTEGRQTALTESGLQADSFSLPSYGPILSQPGRHLLPSVGWETGSERQLGVADSFGHRINNNLVTARRWELHIAKVQDHGQVEHLPRIVISHRLQLESPRSFCQPLAVPILYSDAKFPGLSRFGTL